MIRQFKLSESHTSADMGRVKPMLKAWSELGFYLSHAPIGPKEGSFWCPAEFSTRTRKSEFVLAVNLIVLDVEEKATTPPTLHEAIELCQAVGWQAIGHTTHTHTADKPRYRLVLTPSEPIAPARLRAVVDAVADRLGLDTCTDLKASGDPARLYFRPRRAAGSPFEYDGCPGGDVDLLTLPTPAPKPAPAAAHPAPTSYGTDLPDDALIDTRNALLCISSDDYATWIEVGRHLKKHGSTGQLLWIEWSARSQKWKAGDAAKWATFTEPSEAGYKAVLAMAQRNGWANPAKRTSAAKPPAPAPDTDVVSFVSDIDWGDDPVPGATPPPLSDKWEDPQPLPDALPPVARFDAALLPEALRGWVADIAHRMQCPPDFVAVGALTAVSSLVGARAVIKPKAHDDWAVVPNLWGVVIGKPGVMKSPALGDALAPLHRLEATERDAWKTEHADWEIECKVADMASEAREKQAKQLAEKDPVGARALLQPVERPPRPKARRFVVNDATVEKLADLLIANPWGTLVFRDELHGLLCSMDRAGQEGSRGFYLTGYDGNQGHAVDRIGRGESYVPRVCLAMLGGMQPGKLQSYVREAVSGGAGDDGLLQRFGLAVWPDISREFTHVDQWPNTQAKQAAWAVFDRLNQLQPASKTEPQEWRFSPEAQKLFVEWLIPFETEIRGDDLHPALVSHLSKYRKLVPALALLLALIETPDSGGVVHAGEAAQALAWADYLRTHAERIYSAATTPETSGAAALLAKIKAGKLCDSDGVLLESFTPREVAVKGWAGLTAPDDVRKAAAMLSDYGWLFSTVIRSPDPAGRGRPSERFLVNPVLLDKGSQ